MKTGRPPTCLCGECGKCRHRVRARLRYQSLSIEERRAVIAARDPERVKANDRARYYRNYEDRRARMQEYAQLHPGKAREANRRWLARNPEKYRAHNAVSNAVRDGYLVRPLFCEECGSGVRIQAHHDDYSKPLEVRWLCTRCHGVTHRKVA